MAYNQAIISTLSELATFKAKDGNHFKARAYDREKEKFMLLTKPINSIDDLKGIKIGASTKKVILELLNTGKVEDLEKSRRNPKYDFADVYGIGPKKAEELVKVHNIQSIEELREKQNDVLNDVQIKGLRYYEDVLERIPRKEIQLYEKKMNAIFDELNTDGKASMTIVGSYRRGAKDSGDIDVIITSTKKKTDIFERFLDELSKKKILTEFLSRGKKKSLTVGKLRGKPARRLDFMQTSSDEWAFAILYFTGSKLFNTLMRARANEMELTMNEHGLYNFIKKKKGEKLSKKFKDEQSIFKYLGIKYVTPEERNKFENFELI